MVIIINGKGGCGKDTLIEGLEGHVTTIDPKNARATLRSVFNFSAIDRVKEIARHGGWKDDKSDKGRKLLHDLKMAFVEYNDMPLNDLKKKVVYWNSEEWNEPVHFLHIREPEEITRAVEMFKELGIAVETLLIKRSTTDAHTYGNHADDDVERYPYNYIFMNDQDLLTSQSDFRNLIKGIAETRIYH